MLRNRFWKRTPPPEDKSTPKDTKPSYDELVVGIWRVLVLKESHRPWFNFRREDVIAAFALLLRVLYDIYVVSPRLFALRILTELWFAIEGPLLLYSSNRVFFSIEDKIFGNPADEQTNSDLYTAVMYRVACTIFSAYMRWLSGKNKLAHSSRIKYAYEARVFSVRLAFDLPTSQDNTTSNIDPEDVYMFLERGIMIMKDAISLLLHLRLFAHVIGANFNDGGLIYLALCILPIFMRNLISRSIWNKAYLVDATNKSYIRKSALGYFVWGDLKEEAMAAGMNGFLSNEYRNAKDGLGDTPDIPPEWLYPQQRPALSDIVMTLCAESPTLYFAFLALTRPSKLSISQLAILDQAAISLSYGLSDIGYDIDVWPGYFSRMRNVYTALDTKNKMQDGNTPFPRPGYEESAGMAIELRDVSFSYPNSKSERASLSGVSLTIQPGQLVVIVGMNGSGKSTIIKLLSRFYEPTSGSILVDGIPIEEYSVADLRKGIAMLTQDHQLFPLSVEENIKLGSSDAMENDQMMGEAAAAAGAESIINRFSDRYNTVLDPVSIGYISYAGEGNAQLETLQKDLDKPANVSGGEKQKLVAARTFMRLLASPVKLVAVDEPSSALDPEAEHRLFANLRQERKGRTMIFVTHRFGHLTKYADLIICIKEGEVVETGTHTDLMDKDGEYARLYNIQAEGFAQLNDLAPVENCLGAVEEDHQQDTHISV